MRRYASILALLTACVGEQITAPSQLVERSANQDFGINGVAGLTFMTRNLYPGANLDRVIAAPFNLIPFAVAQAYADIQLTDFRYRAAAFANEIERTRPDVIGLQEAVLIRIQAAGDFLAPDGSIQNPFPNATTVVRDFLQILRDTLAARGLAYQLVGKVQDLDVELPMIVGIVGGIPQFSDVRLTDFDAILARTDLPVSQVATGNYSTYLTQFGFLPVLRGWVSFTTTMRGTDYRIVSTHPESGSGPPEAVRLAQLQELVALVAGETRNTVILGDLNDEPGTPSIDALVQAGFVDAWQEAVGRPTLTCCHAELLDEAVTAFYQRVDYVLVRDAWAGPGIVGRVEATLSGLLPSERIPGPAGLLWASDHAGVAAAMRLPPAR